MKLPNSKEHWFSFNNSCISLREWGPGQHPARTELENSSHCLLFIHGRFGSSEIWSALIDQLAGQYRCLAVDLPGYGRSFTVGPSVPSFLEHVNLIVEITEKFTIGNERMIVVGHDVGGGIAQLSAIKVPNKILALVLINSACISQRLGKINSTIYGWLARLALSQLLRQANTMAPDTKGTLYWPWKNKRFRKSLAKSFSAISDSWPWHYERKFWKETLKKMSQPVLLLWGQNDSINPPEIGAELVQNLPEAYFFLNQNCSHWPCLEQPQWVLSKMKDFLFKIGNNTAPASIATAPAPSSSNAGMGTNVGIRTSADVRTDSGMRTTLA